MINRLILIFLFLDAVDACQCFNLILIVPGPKELDIQKREAGQVVLLGNYDGGPSTNGSISVVKGVTSTGRPTTRYVTMFTGALFEEERRAELERQKRREDEVP